MAAAVKYEGKLRDAGPRRRGWRAKVYPAVEGGYDYARAKFKDPGSGKWVTRHLDPDDAADPEAYLRRLDHALDRRVVVEARTEKTTMAELKVMYLDWLRSQGRDESYIHKVDNLLHVWVTADDGDLPVEQWGPTHTSKWVGAARKKLSASRVEDLGTALSGLKKTAYRRNERGVRLLDPADDPTEGVSTTRSANIEGAHRDYVPPRLRPTSDHVESIESAAATDVQWGWEPTLLRVGTFCGPRLSEQMAFRDIDVDFVNRELLVQNTIRWPKPGRDIAMALKPTKTKTRRRTPYVNSLHEPLLVMCRKSLGLAEDATVEEVTAAQQAKRDAKFDALDEAAWKRGLPRPIEADEGLLFIRPDTGLPPTKEQWGDRFRQWRAESTWPAYIPWKNARHHTVSFWRRVLVNEHGAPADWDVIGLWLGNDPATLQAHYLIPNEDASADARATLDKY